jgi:hypothetical protein
MARLRIWFRRHVRSLIHSPDNKTQQQERRRSTTSIPLRDLSISAPILFSNDGINFRVPVARSKPRPYSLPVQHFNGPSLEDAILSSTTDHQVPFSKSEVLEDVHSVSTPSTLVEETEEIEAAPSLCSDSDSDYDTMPEYLWPATPTSPTRSTRRMSFLRILGTTPDYHTTPSSSRPQSFAASQFSDSREPNRLSHYSAMSREIARREKRVSVLSRSSSKRASVVSQAGRRRASVMSVGTTSNRESGIEWDEQGVGRRFSRRMSWGFETYATHTSAYAPVRI